MAADICSWDWKQRGDGMSSKDMSDKVSCSREALVRSRATTPSVEKITLYIYLQYNIQLSECYMFELSLRLGRKRKMCLIPRSVDGIFAIFFSFSFLNLLSESFLDKSSDGICTFSFFSAIKVQRIVHD